MNEKITELLKTATDNILGVPVVDQKKFAELIVGECIDSIKNNVWGVTMCGTDTKGLCIRAIKEHFGVEE